MSDVQEVPQETADQKVARYILAMYREQHPDHHLSTCDLVEVVHPEAENGVYGCDTGCEHATFTATIRCPHEQHRDFRYGEFGTIADILDELDREPAPPVPLVLDPDLTARATLIRMEISTEVAQWIAQVDGMAASWVGSASTQLEVKVSSNARGDRLLEMVDSTSGVVVHWHWWVLRA